MSENETKNENETNDLKNETMNTVRDVKETVKNINIKEEAQKSKGYIKQLIQDPTGKINSIMNDSKNTHFKIALLALIIWTIIAFVNAISVYNTSFLYMMSHILGIIKLTITPIISILVLAVILFALNKENKKSLSTMITTTVTMRLPVMLGDVIGLLTLISSSASKLTSPISGFLSIISIIFIFVGVKKLFIIEEENEAITKFAIVIGIFYIVKFVLSFLGLYI